MINKALRLTREFHRMKQSELAKRLKISTSYLSEIETGRKPPSIELLDSYAEIFRVPASTFLLFKEKSHGADAKQKERAGKLLAFFEWVTSEDCDGDAEEEKKISTTRTPQKAIHAG